MKNDINSNEIVKCNRKILIVFVIFILIIIGLFVFYENKNNDENKIIENEKRETEQPATNDLYKWVVDANYVTVDLLKLYRTFNEEVNEKVLDGLKYHVDEEKYDFIEQAEKALENIRLPYFNIDSEDAVLVNQEIKKEFNKNMAYLLPFWDDNNTVFPMVDFSSDYRSVIHENVLSVVVTCDSWHYDHHAFSMTYNFDLNSGKLLSYQDVYELLGFFPSNIDEKIKRTIESIFTNKEAALRLVDDHIYHRLKDFIVDEIQDGANFKKEIDESYRNYLDSKNTMQYFIDENNQLNIVVRLSVPVQQGFYDAIIIIE